MTTLIEAALPGVRGPRARGLLSLLALCLAPTLAAAAGPAPAHAEPCAGGTEPFRRTELFFGLSRPQGVVTEEEFKAFVDARITPRFPEGLTIVTGVGQFRDARGVILVEGAKVLTVLYSPADDGAHARIEHIRGDYRRAFDQQSVLRADSRVCVAF